jgi:hypothetical protein
LIGLVLGLEIEAHPERKDNVMGSSFTVMLTGIQFRQDRNEVRDKLAQLFKCEPERIEGLLGRAPVAVKSGLGMEMALKYQKAIQDAGAECVVKSGTE